MSCHRFLLVIGFAAMLPANPVVSQTPQPVPAAPGTPQGSAESSTKKKPSGKHQHDFLIKGTVFTQEGLSLAGARIQIRKEGQKSFHWNDVANSRGEFAIRVIQGAKYEVVVSEKGWKDQLKTVDATGSDRVEEIVFHMERGGTKPS